MSKKIIALIVCVLVAIGGIVAIFAFNNRESEQNNQNTNLAQSENSNNSRAKNNDEENNNRTGTTNQVTNNEENNNTTSNKKALVLYFSQSGNTETVAKFIHEEAHGDIIKLETQKAYPSDYNELVNYAQEEQRNNERPALKTKINNIDQYDVIFLGYPNWWADMPMPLYTFLDEYDLSGKTIAPFITHGGSGLSGTPNKIKKEEPNATVTEGLAISGSSASSSKSTVQNWLSKIGF